MRKVRDYDAELKALGDKARALRAKKVQQLGELVTSTGADALDADVLAGALLHIVAEAQVEGNREAWRWNATRPHCSICCATKACPLPSPPE